MYTFTAKFEKEKNQNIYFLDLKVNIWVISLEGVGVYATEAKHETFLA